MADKDGGGSRLDRLLRLLETGSTPAARHEAARQIGELAAAHSNQLPNLLRRVRPRRFVAGCPNPILRGSRRPRLRRARRAHRTDAPPYLPEHPDTSQIRAFLKNKQWETRVAAAKTISCICEGVKHATVADVARLAGINPEAAAEAALALPPSAVAAADAAVDLTFDEFDIVGVIERAAPLLASKVGDFDLSDVDDAKLSKAERLKMAKQTLRQRLGMAIESDGAAETVKGEDAKPTNLNVNKFIDVDDLVGEDDVAEVKTEAPAAAAARWTPQISASSARESATD